MATLTNLSTHKTHTHQVSSPTNQKQSTCISRIPGCLFQNYHRDRKKKTDATASRPLTGTTPHHTTLRSCVLPSPVPRSHEFIVARRMTWRLHLPLCAVVDFLRVKAPNTCRGVRASAEYNIARTNVSLRAVCYTLVKQIGNQWYAATR